MRTDRRNIFWACSALCATAILLPAQNLTTLASFGNTYAGGGPAKAVVQGPDGSFYGTTLGGGPSQNGTIFKIAPDGTFTTLYGFCSKDNCPDGSQPNGLILASDGNLYGTTQAGGAN
ncbi:MAG TPA: choice-of-anchor tandem repeat GloVer-containing protein, partial [Bryobacteraceae bacterium]|nr:choice-of-anchor tandem repeat GloVer-containing protein [Bryobacteraceae bacterium]